MCTGYLIISRTAHNSCKGVNKSHLPKHAVIQYPIMST